MALYPLMVPLFIATAALGALVGWRAWRAAGLSGSRGAWTVAPAGLLGPLLTMWPMDSCTFEPNRTGLDIAVGVVAFAAGAAVAIAVVAWVGRALSLPGGASNLDTGDNYGSWKGGRGIPWLLLLPTLVILAFFLYWPLAETFRLSTHLVRLNAPIEPYTCVDNYTVMLGPSIEWWWVVPVVLLALVAAAEFLARRFADPVSDLPGGLRWLRGVLMVVAAVTVAAAMFGADYRRYFANTLLFTGAIVVVGLAVGLGIALLVSLPIKGRAVYRTLLIWPFAISPAIAGILFSLLFDPLIGMLGHVYEALTPWSMPAFATNPVLAKIVVILASIWKNLGFTILFYIAGLQNVPTSMLEAAKLDGANAWQRFRHFILPSLTPITFFLVVTNVTYGFFQVFGSIEYLTKGGPSGATTDALTQIYIVQNSNVGEGAAASVVLFAMVLAVTAWQFRASGRRVHYGA
ncbi:MAG TPA: sugar ABC transporter permease [Stackebrandtia sp.]|uniref:carbohydrate ABC transporter permease n=1 Tax=Stackebrandtia sp. TaxID=2023065 RepID=UPI002D45ACCE|nr:sugar ABC transporter permease [Stackebrandtia sp.]HZE39565.1 sugar ABC transporter permease [Stackebrandtia sp.]